LAPGRNFPKNYFFRNLARKMTPGGHFCQNYFLGTRSEKWS
jgi:hypothetical protein